MIPLIYARPDEEVIIRSIGGSPEERKRLSGLGFIAGCAATVVARVDGDVIVRIGETRIAISEQLAQLIKV